MKKEEIINNSHFKVWYDENNNAVMLKEHCLDAMEEYAQQAIAEHEAKQWKKVLDVMPLERENVLATNGYRIFETSWEEFTNQDRDWFIKKYSYWMIKPKLPEPYKPG